MAANPYTQWQREVHEAKPRKPAPPTMSPEKRAQSNANMANRWIAAGANDYYQTQLAALQQPPTDPYGGSGAGIGGGGRGGGGYGYGGGGGGGYIDHFAEIRKQLEAQLNQQRDAARGALPGYLADYNKQVGQVGKENAALTKGYSQQINKILSQLLGQANQQNSALVRDLGAQGGPTSGIQAQAGQNVLGLKNVGGAQDAYNLRLAQIMASANADAKRAGASVNQAASGQLDNSYLQALMKIQAMR